jgi:hypothetical protein
MKNGFTSADIKMRRFRRIFFPTALLLALATFVLTPLRTVISQSGRGQQPESKKQPSGKPKPPGPRPKIREPEDLPQQKGKGGKESEETIRINSDLVNVVVTAAGGPTNALLDFKQEDFEILEDGVPQEISNFSRVADQPLKMVMLFDTSMSVAQALDFERRANSRSIIAKWLKLRLIRRKRFACVRSTTCSAMGRRFALSFSS